MSTDKGLPTQPASLTASVQAIRDGTVIRSEIGVNEQALEGIRNIYEMVASGDVVGFAIALQHADKAVSCARCGYRQTYQMVGALNVMIIDAASRSPTVPVAFRNALALAARRSSSRRSRIALAAAAGCAWLQKRFNG
jgi:hypothetical protein